MRKHELQKYISQLDDHLPILINHFQISNPHKLFGIRITVQQYLALGAIINKGKSKITDLSKSLGVALSTMTELVDRLAKRGFVKRIKDVRDRRIVWVDLTDIGRTIFKKVNRKKQEHIASILKNLTHHDRNALVGILKVVSNATRRAEFIKMEV